MPTAFFPKFVIGVKLVLVVSNQACVVLEEVIVFMCWSQWSQRVPEVAFFEPMVIYCKYRKPFMLVGCYPMLI